MSRVARNFRIETDFAIFFLYADLNREKFSFIRQCKFEPNPEFVYNGTQLTYLAAEHVTHSMMKLRYASYYPSFIEVVMSNFQHDMGYIMSHTCIHDIVQKMVGMKHSSSVWNKASFDCFARFMMQLNEKIKFRESFALLNSVCYDYAHQINLQVMPELEQHVISNWESFTVFQKKLTVGLSHYVFRFGKIMTIEQYKEILRMLD